MSAYVMGPPSDRPTYSLVGRSGCTGCFVFTAVVTKTWSPQATGELQLRPGISIFQATFCVSLQVSGRAGLSAATPEREPRNCGHCSPCAIADTAARASTAMARRPVFTAHTIHRFVSHCCRFLPSREQMPEIPISTLNESTILSCDLKETRYGVRSERERNAAYPRCR